jgi:HlyD family secretion protein
MGTSISTKKISIVLGVVLLAVIVFLLGPKPMPVDIGKLSRGPLQIVVESEGRTRIRHIYTVTAPVSGRLQRVTLKAGDAVKAGETLLTQIEPSSPEFLDFRTTAQRQAKVSASSAQCELAKADIRRAEAALDYAKADLRRNQALVDKHFVSAQALDQAQLAVRTREAELAVAKKTLAAREAELAMDQAALMPTRLPQGASNIVNLIAPISGKVLRVLEESETSVSPVSLGKPIMEIGDPQDIEVLAEMLSVNAAKIRVGAQAQIVGWGGGKALKGHVRRIEPYGFTKISALGIEEQRVNVLIDFDEPPENWNVMEHGYRVDVQVVVWEGGNILKVPMGALFRDGNEWAAYSIDKDDHAQLRHVSIGHSTSQEAEVLNGLAESDSVILHPNDRLRDGDFVMDRQVMEAGGPRPAKQEPSKEEHPKSEQKSFLKKGAQK